jgi:inosine-uridine nucleoside N-ribohydrolase
MDPEFARLAKELVFMGGSLKPQTSDPEFANTPRHEFNLWFDPEAAHIVLSAPWKKIVDTTVDISLKTQLTAEMLDRLKNSDAPPAKYAGTYTQLRGFDYLWDEMAAIAWIDPSVITKRENRYMDVDLDRGAGYGNTLTWSEKDKPEIGARLVEIQDDYDREKFYKTFVDLLSAPTPRASGTNKAAIR